MVEACRGELSLFSCAVTFAANDSPKAIAITNPAVLENRFCLSSSVTRANKSLSRVSSICTRISPFQISPSDAPKETHAILDHSSATQARLQREMRSSDTSTYYQGIGGNPASKRHSFQQH